MADALDSGSSGGDSVQVQVLSLAPLETRLKLCFHRVFLKKESFKMIYEKICDIRNNSVLDKILKFFDGKLFPLCYAFLALISSFVGGEVPFFILTALIVIFTAVMSRDSKPVIVPLVLVVYGMSRVHTPQFPNYSDYMYRTSVLAIIGVSVVLVLAAFVFRMIVYKNIQKFWKIKTVTKWGLLALGGALILNGVFSQQYVLKNLLLGFILAASFLFFYIYILNTLEWKTDTAEYIAHVLTIACFVIALQLFKALLFDGIIQNGAINKHYLNLGWGMSNNVGGMLAMFMPACFYLSYREQNRLKSCLYYVSGFIVIFCVALTLSRTALLMGGVALLAIMILMSLRGQNVRFVRIFNGALIGCGIVLCLVFREKIFSLFEHYLDKGFDDSERVFIWKSGLQNFISAPIFGVGFYTPIAPDWSYNIGNWLFPDMYHNIFVQMLAACGIIGAAAYLFHFVQAGFLFFKKITIERLFFFCVVGILTAMSMLDNHIFHVFPALIYALLFAVAEQDLLRKREDTVEKTEGGRFYESFPFI